MAQEEVSAENWLMKQASVSALRLVQTQSVLLDPIGRFLQEVAKDWNNRSEGLRAVPEARGDKSPVIPKRASRPSSPIESIQPPLVNLVEGSRD